MRVVSLMAVLKVHLSALEKEMQVVVDVLERRQVHFGSG